MCVCTCVCTCMHMHGYVPWPGVHRSIVKLIFYQLSDSTIATIIFITVGCKIPTSHSLTLLVFWDSTITYHCTDNTLGNTTILQSVCTEMGKWSPDPEDMCHLGQGINTNPDKCQIICGGIATLSGPMPWRDQEHIFPMSLPNDTHISVTISQ